MASLGTGKHVAISERFRETLENKFPQNILPLGQDYKYLFVQQADSEFPDDDSDFPPTILLAKKFDIVGVLAHWKDFSGTFSCKLKVADQEISGTDFVDTDFQASPLEAKIYDELLPYKSPERITVKVVESTDIEQWEAIFIMREVLK